MKQDPLQGLRDDLRREREFRARALQNFLAKGGTIEEWTQPIRRPK